MKRLVTSILFAIALSLFVPCVALAATQTVTFADENLYTAMLDELGTKATAHDDDNKTIDVDPTTVTTLDLSNRYLSKLTGLEAFTSLTELSLANNALASSSSNDVLAPIKNITTLTKLDAHGNYLVNADLANVTTLTNLTWLDLSGNRLKDETSAATTDVFQRLKLLTSLTHLDVGLNSARSLSGVEQLTNLQYLDVYDNYISDLAPLDGRTTITHLNLGRNSDLGGNPSTTHIAKLNTLTNLTWLDFSLNKASGIVEAIRDLTGLSYLQLQSNNISNISGLSNKSQLKTLILAYNDVYDLAALAGKPELEVLNLQGNQLDKKTSASGVTPEVYFDSLTMVFNSSSANGLIWPKLKELDVSKNYSWALKTTYAEHLTKLFELSQSSTDGFQLNFNYDRIKDYDSHIVAANNDDGTPKSGSTWGYTKLSALPHVEGGIKYVTYDDFGARHNGSYDDYIAMINAHDFANSCGCEVRATSNTTYHIFRSYDTSYYNANTNIDWKGATFVVHDEDVEHNPGRATPLLCLRPSRRAATSDELLANAKLATICTNNDIITIKNENDTDGKPKNQTLSFVPKRNTTKLKGLNSEFDAALATLKSKGYTRVFVEIENERVRQYNRFGSGTTSAQWDGVVTDINGELEGPFMWDFDAITSIKLTPIPATRGYVKNGTFVQKPSERRSEIPSGSSSRTTYYLRNLQIRDCAGVDVSNVKHTVEDVVDGRPVASGNFYGFFNFQHTADISMVDCGVYTRRFAGTGLSTYGFNLDYATNVLLEGLVCNGINSDGTANVTRHEQAMADDRRWGIMANNHVKHVTYKNCKINRIDAHEGYYDLVVQNCVVGSWGFRLTGNGPLLIENTTVQSDAFITLRSDYGSTWDGVARIVNCTHTYDGVWSQRLIMFSAGWDDSAKTQIHDFGYSCRMPNVYVENLTVDESRYKTANNRENYEVIQPQSGSGAEKRAAAYGCDDVVLNGIKFVNYASTMGKLPRFFASTNGTKAGTAFSGERNYLVARVTAESDGADITRQLFVGAADEFFVPDASGKTGCSASMMAALRAGKATGFNRAALSGKCFVTKNPVSLSVAADVDRDGAISNVKVKVLKDGAVLEAEQAVSGTWSKTFSAQGRYQVVVSSVNVRGDSWTGSKTLEFEISDRSWTEWEVVTPATCVSTGLRRRSEVGNASNVEEEVLAIDPNAHDWGEWQVTKAATDSEDGEAKRTCKRDASHVETRVIPKGAGGEVETPASPEEPAGPETPASSEEPGTAASPGTPASPDAPVTPTNPGAPAIGSWEWVDGVWRYRDASGVLTTGWAWIGSSWFFFDASGAMRTGWMWEDGNWYYLSEGFCGVPSGALWAGWLPWGGSWWWLNNNNTLGLFGSMWRSRWVFDRRGWYWLDGDGRMATGWIWDGAGWYYLAPDGRWVA